MHGVEIRTYTLKKDASLLYVPHLCIDTSTWVEFWDQIQVDAINPHE
jgi:hypothetical protein